MLKYVRTPAGRRHSATTVLAALSVFALAACEGDDDLPTRPVVRNVPTITVTPKATTLAVGATQQLSAVVRNEGGTVINVPVRYTSSDPDVITVSTSGLVTAVAPGNGSVVASAENGARIAASFSVAPVSASSLVIQGFDDPVRIVSVGGSRQLFVNQFDADGNPLSTPITWTSSNPAAATVNSAGVVIGVSEGPTTITATSGSASATYTITSGLFVSTLALTPNPVIAAMGATAQITATARDGTGAILAGRPITWTSSNTAAVTVSETGLASVDATEFGSSLITASTTDLAGTTTATTLVNPLRHGVALTGIEGPSTARYVFYVQLPASRTGLTVSLSGGTGDPDLYIDNPAGTQVCARENGAGVTETCALTSGLTAGLWRVRVEGWTAFTGWTLTTTIAPAP